MSRIAIFVDAGYFFAQVLKLLGDERSSRDQLEVEYLKMREAFLAEAAKQFPRSELLRVYWYDGPGPNGKTYAHKMIDELDDFKLRLGSRNAMGQQKEVDGLIIADMITLVNNKAISDAILVSGDADIIPGVTVVQALGARVHVLSVGAASLVSSGAGHSMSPHLASEADHKADWPKSLIASFASVRLCPAAAAALLEAQERAAKAVQIGKEARATSEAGGSSESLEKAPANSASAPAPKTAPASAQAQQKPHDGERLPEGVPAGAPAQPSPSMPSQPASGRTSRREYFAMAEAFVEKMRLEAKEHVLEEYQAVGEAMPKMLPKNLDGQLLFYGKSMLGRILTTDDKWHLREQLRMILIAKIEGARKEAQAKPLAEEARPQTAEEAQEEKERGELHERLVGAFAERMREFESRGCEQEASSAAESQEAGAPRQDESSLAKGAASAWAGKNVFSVAQYTASPLGATIGWMASLAMRHAKRRAASQ